ncbi:hypothetical protein BKA70DRAFT_1571910 [Coprinopsis sp. MPI-PUGE-AT-0042]|nr:hypothetical protein BKA70DRAFT_1571910 [Coprinopsis sp. MPI-PUGE-AT-0042]
MLHLRGQAQIRDIDLDILVVRELLDLLEERGAVRGYGINKLPPRAAFKTATGERFTADEVYQAGKKAMEHTQNGTKDRGYPKKGSGFKKEAKKLDDLKMKGVGKAGKKPSIDKLGSERWDLHVASHDPKKPIPEGTGATENPHDESQSQDPARLEEEGFQEIVVAGPFAL